MNDIFITPLETATHIALSAKTKRLSLNLSQLSLSERAGVSFSVLKKFERTGKISLESLLKLALALGSLHEFTTLFKQTPPSKLTTLDALLEQNIRKRGRK